MGTAAVLTCPRLGDVPRGVPTEEQPYCGVGKGMDMAGLQLPRPLRSARDAQETPGSLKHHSGKGLSLHPGPPGMDKADLPGAPARRGSPTSSSALSPLLHRDHQPPMLCPCCRARRGCPLRVTLRAPGAEPAALPLLQDRAGQLQPLPAEQEHPPRTGSVERAGDPAAQPDPGRPAEASAQPIPGDPQRPPRPRWHRGRGSPARARGKGPGSGAMGDGVGAHAWERSWEEREEDGSPAAAACDNPGAPVRTGCTQPGARCARGKAGHRGELEAQGTAGTGVPRRWGRDRESRSWVHSGLRGASGLGAAEGCPRGPGPGCTHRWALLPARRLRRGPRTSLPRPRREQKPFPGQVRSAAGHAGTCSPSRRLPGHPRLPAPRGCSPLGDPARSPGSPLALLRPRTPAVSPAARSWWDRGSWDTLSCRSEGTPWWARATSLPPALGSARSGDGRRTRPLLGQAGDSWI